MENQNDQQKKVDYQNLFDSLVKESEEKEIKKSQTSATVSKKRELSGVAQKKTKNSREKTTYRQATEKLTALPQVKGKFYRPVCPYCGNKVGLPRVWLIKSKGDYICTECGNRSAVVIDKIVVPFAIASCSISTILILLFTFLTDMHIWSVILIFLPFLCFFGSCIFLVRLKKFAPHSAKQKTDQEQLQHTRIL